MITANGYFLQLSMQAQAQGKDVQSTLEAAEKQLKVSLKNKLLLDDEWNSGAKVLSLLKGVNSFTSLAIRPLQWFKEMTVGSMTNISRAWSNAG